MSLPNVHSNLRRSISWPVVAALALIIFVFLAHRTISIQRGDISAQITFKDLSLRIENKLKEEAVSGEKGANDVAAVLAGLSSSAQETFLEIFLVVDTHTFIDPADLENRAFSANFYELLNAGLIQYKNRKQGELEISVYGRQMRDRIQDALVRDYITRYVKKPKRE